MTEECLSKVGEALSLISQYDAAGYLRIRDRVSGILIAGKEPFLAAHWNAPSRLCILTQVYVASERTSVVDVSTTIVHEGMHAYLDSLGARYDDGKRAHIEVLCTMAELAFLRTLPNTSDLLEPLSRRLYAYASGDENTWSDATRMRKTYRHLRNLEIPRWGARAVIKCALWLRKRAA